MTPDQFVRERAGGWTTLARLSRRTVSHLSPGEALDLAARHRAAAADLAFARRRFPGESIVEDLEQIVERSRASLTAARPATGASIRQLVRRDYWALVLEQPWSLVVSAALLIVPGILMAIWAVHDPAAAARVLPDSVRSGTATTHGSLGLPVNVQAGAAGFVTANNIGVAARAFAGGILAGLGTAYVLVNNGMLLGGVAAYAGRAGTGARFVQLVAPHGILELSCIVIAGAAGLRIARAVIDPGTGRRRDALAAEARRSVIILIGTVPYFAIAGAIEGFVTPRGLATPAAVAVGVMAAALLWVPLIVIGRRSRDRATVALLDA